MSSRAMPACSRHCSSGRKMVSFGTGRVSEEDMIRSVRKRFDLTPRGIIESLDLARPIFRKTACHGHFGRSEAEFTWERTDLADDLRRDLGL